MSTRTRLLASAACLGAVLVPLAAASQAPKEPYFRFRDIRVPPGPGTVVVTDPVKTDPVTTDPTKTDPTKTDPVTTDPGDPTIPPTTPTTEPTDPTQPTGPEVMALDLTYQQPDPGLVVNTTPEYYGGGSFNADGAWPHTFTATGAPPGMTVVNDEECDCGRLTGAPTAKGLYPVAVKVVDGNGNAGSGTFTVAVTDAVGSGTPLAFMAPPPVLYVGQAYYGPRATYSPTREWYTGVAWTLKSGTLPPGVSINTEASRTGSGNLFGSQNVPTRADTYDGIVLTGTPDNGDAPADTPPFSITVKPLALSVTATPQVVSILPGATFNRRSTFKGLARYGNLTSQNDYYEMRNLGQSYELVPTNGSSVPDGLTFDDENLTFDGQPAVAGQKGTFKIRATVAGTTAESPEFTIQVKNELNVVVSQPSCEYVPEMPGFFGNPPVPAHTDCREEFVPPGGAVNIPNDFPSAVSLKVFGADPSTCSATPTSALPSGLAMSGLSLSGTTTAEGQVTTSFNVACAGMPAKTAGPYTLKVPAAAAWQPPLVFVTVSHAEFREYCNYIFNSDEAAARGPFTAVSGTNVPGWMRISPDGQACNTTGMTNGVFNSTVDGQTFVGTLSATDSKGKRSTWQVRYGGLMEPN